MRTAVSRTPGIVLLSILILILLYASASIEPVVPVVQQGRMMCDGEHAWNFPLAELPAHVPFDLGTLTLYADFDHASGGYVDVYFINATMRNYKEYLETGFRINGPERKVSNDGEVWLRSEPVYSTLIDETPIWFSMAPGHFMVARKPFYRGDERHQIRFEFRNLASNSVNGVVPQDEIEACKYDQVAMFRLSSKSAREVLFGSPPILIHDAVERQEYLKFYKRLTLRLAAEGRVGGADELLHEYLWMPEAEE